MKERTGVKVPRVRFQEFEGGWDDEPIAEVLSEKKRPIILKDHQRYELITVKRRNEGVVSRGHLWGREILVKNYSQLEAGDFVISKRQVVHGATGIVSPELDRAIVSNEYLIAVGNSKISTEFLTLLACLPDMRRKFFLSSYGVDIEKLFFDAEDWKKRNVTIPRLAEQNRIGRYFRELDSLILLHQRKHEKLVALKKAMLQKMFPRADAATPEIRLKGFSGDWEKKKLGKLATFSKGQGYSKSDLTASGVPIVLYGSMYVNYQTVISDVNTFVTEKKGSIKSVGGEVIVPASGETAEDIARASAVIKKGIVLGGDLNIVIPSSELDSSFLALTLSNGRPQQELARRAQGKTVVHVRKADLEPIMIPYPKLDEQKKIGAYFCKIEKLISKHAIQLRKLRHIKSACLNKMFV
jgi:type I restriction enzyme S subunit